jgi:hypothetical protein
MVGSVDVGSVAVALTGVVVGAVLGFVASLIDARLRRQRRGRAAARLIWLELMASRNAIRGIRELRDRLFLDTPFSFDVWQAERSSFAEVADGLALAQVGLAYHWLAGLPKQLALASEVAVTLEDAASPELPADTWLTNLDPYLGNVFEQVELALVQLDRYNRLAKVTVDYSQLTSGREAQETTRSP